MSVRGLSVAVALLGTIVPAYADSWSDFYAQQGPGITTIEMRKSWQDRVGDAVHNAQPYEWPHYEYSEATLSNAPRWLLLDCHLRRDRWRLSPRAHYSWRKVCR
jgi:hypothetical protein